MSIHTMRLAFRPLEEQFAFQVQQLNQLKERLWQQSTFYRRQWESIQAPAITLHSLRDLQQFPCTTKEDIQLQESDFYCVDPQHFREYNTTSGTLGRPIAVPLTASDLDRLAYNEQLSFEKLQIQAGEPVQLMLTLDRLFMAGMSYYGGLKHIGALVLRTGAGVPQLQWDTIFRYRPTTLVAVPSFLLKMLDYADAHSIPYQTSGVSKILAIGESIRDDRLAGNTLYYKIKERWDVALYSTYASTEMQTGFTECGQHCGGHQHTDLIVTEIIDENGQQVAEGELGEVCITTLGIEAMPLWRYRTGDMARMYYDSCACGRNAPRISGIAGRRQQMLKVKGTTLYPTAIFDALDHTDLVTDYLVEAFTNPLGQDDLLIYIFTRQETSPSLTEQLQLYLKGKLKITPAFQLVSEQQMLRMQFPEASRKQIKFIDKRTYSL